MCRCCIFLLFFHFPQEEQFVHILKCLSIGANNTVQRKKNYSIMKCWQIPDSVNLHNIMYSNTECVF